MPVVGQNFVYSTQMNPVVYLRTGSVFCILKQAVSEHKCMHSTVGLKLTKAELLTSWHEFRRYSMWKLSKDCITDLRTHKICLSLTFTAFGSSSSELWNKTYPESEEETPFTRLTDSKGSRKSVFLSRSCLGPFTPATELGLMLQVCGLTI